MSNDRSRLLFRSQIARNLNNLEQKFNDINGNLGQLVQKSSSVLCGIDALVTALDRIGDVIEDQATARKKQNKLLEDIAVGVNKLVDINLARNFDSGNSSARSVQVGARASTRSVFIDDEAEEDHRTPSEIDDDTQPEGTVEVIELDHPGMGLMAGDIEEESSSSRSSKRARN